MRLGVGAALDQRRDLAQLVVRGAEVEREPSTPHLLDPVHEHGLQGESGRLSLDVVAGTLDQGRAAERVECAIELRRIR